MRFMIGMAKARLRIENEKGLNYHYPAFGLR